MVIDFLKNIIQVLNLTCHIHALHFALLMQYGHTCDINVIITIILRDIAWFDFFSFCADVIILHYIAWFGIQ